MVQIVYFALILSLISTSIYGDIGLPQIYPQGKGAIRFKRVAPEEKLSDVTDVKDATNIINVKNPIIHINETIISNNNDSTKISNKVNKVAVSLNNTTEFNNNSILKIETNHLDDDPAGALMRGFYVFLGITVFLLLYIAIRMYRIRNGSKPPVMVRKYGVLTNRGDVEMLPLPLSEEDDDDTVFELNNHTNRN